MKVVNIKNQKYDLYIGRKNEFYNLPESKWHNPFKRSDYELSDVLSLYEKYIRTGPLYSQLHELEGLILGCWCPSPEKCHGGVLIKLWNEKKLNDLLSMEN